MGWQIWEGWMYLATVLDCYSKKAVGYAMADHMRIPLITEAFSEQLQSLEQVLRFMSPRDGGDVADMPGWLNNDSDTTIRFRFDPREPDLDHS